jgi:N-acyl-D-aspartate/D-glutamate deacylase
VAPQRPAGVDLRHPGPGCDRAGNAADLVAFDPGPRGRDALERVYDMPAGGDRLISDIVGTEHVWVGGQQVRRDGAPGDGAYPGVVVSG